MASLFLHHRSPSCLPPFLYPSASDSFPPPPSLDPFFSLLPSPFPLPSVPSLDLCPAIGRLPDFDRSFPSLPQQPPLVDLRHSDAGCAIRRPTGAQALGPRKTVLQKRGGNAVPAPKKVSKGESRRLKVKLTDEDLANEVRELHALWHNAGKEQKSEARSNEETNTTIDNLKKAKQKRKKDLNKKRKQAMIGEADGKLQETGPISERVDEGKNWTNMQHVVSDSECVSAWAGSVQNGNAQNGKVERFPMTQEEKQLELQRKACNNVLQFIGRSSGSSESDEEDFSESEDDEEDKQKYGGVKAREDEAFEFFLKLFEDNEELHKLYVDNCNVGKFECLICTSIGGKAIKKFGDLISLVMHSLKILNTKKRPEHRGYGRAVCFVLGWDPLRGPGVPKTVRPRGCIPPYDDELDGEISEGDKCLTDLNVENGDDAKLGYKDMEEADKSHEVGELQGHLEVTVNNSTKVSIGGETSAA